ncbi:MAG: hypothetical protein R6U11_08280, partial [Bacteroidales bacterium]
NELVLKRDSSLHFVTFGMTSTYVGRGWGWWRLCRHQPHPDKNPWMSCHFDRREKSRNLYRTTKFRNNEIKQN